MAGPQARASKRPHPDQAKPRSDPGPGRAAPLVATIVLVGLVWAAAPVDAQTIVSRCREIRQSGTYVLDSNVSVDSGTCFEIFTNDTVLDGDGHTIADSGSAAIGINASHLTNVSIRDLRIDGFNHAGILGVQTRDLTVDAITATSEGPGVRLRGADNARLQDVTISGTAGAGLRARSVQDLAFLAGRIEGASGPAIRVDGGARPLVERSALVGNRHGVILDGPTDPEVRFLDVRESSGWDLRVDGGSTALVGALEVGSSRLDLIAHDVQLRSAAATGPDAPYRALGRFLEVQPRSGSAWLNASIRYASDEVRDYQEETLAWWRSNGTTWSRVPGWNVVDPQAQRVRTNVTTFSLLGPVVEEDVTPPETRLLAEGPGPVAGWYTGTVTATLNATDDLSGVNRTEVRVDDGPWRNVTEPLELTADGDHAVRYRSVDVAGNVEATDRETLRIDATPPATTIELSGDRRDDGAFVGTARVEISTADGASGVASTRVRLDDGAWSPYEAPFEVAESGPHTVSARSVDVAGNEETVRDRPFRIAIPDGGGPATLLDVEPAARDLAALDAEPGPTRVRVLGSEGVDDYTLVARHPDGSRTVIGQGRQVDWDTSGLDNGWYRVEAERTGADGQPVTVASTHHLVENPRATLVQAGLAVAVGVLSALAIRSATQAGSRLLDLLDYLWKTIRRALDIEYRERTKRYATLRGRLLVQTVAVAVAAAALAAAVTYAGLVAWDPAAFLSRLPALGAAAVVFSGAFYGGDWLAARVTGDDPRYRLLGSGLLSLGVTSILLRSPFGAPGYVEKRRETPVEGSKLERLQAHRTIAELGAAAATGLLFVAAMQWWRFGFGETGTFLVVMSLATGAIPVPPLPNHRIWRWSPVAGVGVLLAGIFLYVTFQLALLPHWVIAVVGVAGLASVVGFVHTHGQLDWRSWHPGRWTRGRQP